MVNKTTSLLIFLSIFIVNSCGLQMTVPGKAISADDIKKLESEGFNTVGAKNIAEMQNMRTACEYSGQTHKGNICGLDAGVSAAFLLTPREAFYDINNPESFERIKRYGKLRDDYPIMRPKAFPKKDVGLFPDTLAAFWTHELKNFKAQALGFNNFQDLAKIAKREIDEGRPVLIQVRITPSGLPVFLPDQHLGIRTFWNAHWIVLIGYNNQGEGQWLIKDNGGLRDTVIAQLSTKLLVISQPSLEKIANNTELASEVKLYIDDPNLPIFLDDWKKSDDKEQLQRDFKEMKDYNIIIFEKR